MSLQLLFFSILEEQNYILRDAEAEVLFCFSLEESLKRAQMAPLFKVDFFLRHRALDQIHKYMFSSWTVDFLREQIISFSSHFHDLCNMVQNNLVCQV